MLVLLFFISLSFSPTPAHAQTDAHRWAPVLALGVDSEGVLYVATSERGGLYASSDGGRNWRHLGAGIPQAHLYTLRLSPEGHLLLATFEEILLSKDGGSSWETLEGGGAFKDFLVTESGELLGIHWHRGIQWASKEEHRFRDAEGAEGDYLVTAILEAVGGRLWAASLGGGVLASEDGGRSWSAFDEGLKNRLVVALALDGTSGTLFAGALEGGVFRRRGDSPWESVSEGLPADTTVQALAADSAGTVWAGTHGKGLFLLRSGGSVWEPYAAGSAEESSVTAIEPFGEGVVVGTSSHGIFSAEASRSPTPLLLADPITGLAEDGRGGVLALSASGRLYSSDDGGRSWGGIGASSPGASASLLVTSSGRLLVGDRGGVFWSDDGERWTRGSFPAKEVPRRVISPSHGPPAEDSAYSIVETVEGTILAVTWRNGLLKSNDGGRSWSVVDGIDGAYYLALASDGKRAVAVGTDRGFALSLDGGSTWRNRYVVYGVNSLLFAEDGMLRAASRTGFWRFSLDEMELLPEPVEGLGSTGIGSLRRIFRGGGGTLFALRMGALLRLELTPDRDGRTMEPSSLANTNVLSWLLLPDGTILLGSSRSFLRSEDGGRTWQEIELP